MAFAFVNVCIQLWIVFAGIKCLLCLCMHNYACCVFRLNGRLLGSLGCMGCLLVYLACVTNSVHMTSAVEAHGEGAPSPFLRLVIRRGCSRGCAGELARRGITPTQGTTTFPTIKEKTGPILPAAHGPNRGRSRKVV